jgi:hypothetical protein
LKLNCHCKNVVIHASKPSQLTSCNCSICSRYQTLWGYYEPGQVEIEIGSFGIKSYIWGDKEIEFIHCVNCGCVTHYQTLEGSADPRVALNFRMASDTLISAIPLRVFNGKDQL